MIMLLSPPAVNTAAGPHSPQSIMDFLYNSNVNSVRYNSHVSPLRFRLSSLNVQCPNCRNTNDRWSTEPTVRPTLMLLILPGCWVMNCQHAGTILLTLRPSLSDQPLRNWNQILVIKELQISIPSGGAWLANAGLFATHWTLHNKKLLEIKVAFTVYCTVYSRVGKDYGLKTNF